METLIEKAIKIALDAHHGQVDKAGKPYILHTLRLAMLMQDDDEFLVAMLHDVIEDSDYTSDDLIRHGFSQAVVAAAICLTHAEGEDYFAYIRRIRENKIARNVKLSDLQDNMNILRLDAVTEKDFERIRKYHKAWLELSAAKNDADAKSFGIP